MTYSDWTFYKAVEGDKKSLDLVIKQYTPLVHKWARKYGFMAQGNSYEDLVQEGMIGIIEAVETFDLEKTFNGRNIRPMTWVWWKVRGAVQSYARKEKKYPKYALSLEQSDWGNNLEDENYFEVKDEKLPVSIDEILLAGCGSLNTTKAGIIIDRFGLKGRKSMRQGEVAKKYGLSKQATNGHISRFTRKVREKYPNLQEFL